MNPGSRMTKIVATVGPASDAPDTLRKMIEAGMNVARLNLSHGTFEEQTARAERIRQAAAALGANVAVMADTRGVEIRTGPVQGGFAELQPGKFFTLYTDRRNGSAEGVAVSHPGLPEEVEPGTRILLDDGAIELRVVEAKAGAIQCRVVEGGRLEGGRGVNLPDGTVQRNALSGQDREDLLFAAAQGLDYVAASFVQSASDVRAIQHTLAGAGLPIPVIAKIENREGVRNLEEIVACASGTMVARGDLGVEIPLEDVPLAQKRIIHTTVRNGKPVITATQMLSSMERSPRPTRAEVSDVANAILDGTSAVMLAGETAVGRFPVEAVRTMARVAERSEAALPQYGHLQQILPEPSNVVTEAVSQAAITMAHHLDSAAIITLTESGFTPRAISKHRPRCPILAVTPSPRVVSALALNWGVTAIRYDAERSDDAMIAFAIEHLRLSGRVRPGDVVVATAGISQAPGSTNRISVIPV
ncbi:MAG TPA: pyruvate kinase [Myxococcota bacterium]|nr:pyruvate kinase [Myxococcota bacterium]